MLAISCKKPKCPPTDPCLNTVRVTALERELYGLGHFSYTDPNQTMYYLKAVNWSDYAARIRPGQQYDIAYKEVPCKDNGYTYEGNGIARGGCFIPQRKCIIITCLKEVKQKGCFETLINPPSDEKLKGQIISTTGIAGETLNARMGFSGCTENDCAYQLHLLLETDNTMKPLYKPVFMAEPVNTGKEVTCMAYFEKDVCFDLSALKQWCLLQNRSMPNGVTIRLNVNGTYTDLTYMP